MKKLRCYRESWEVVLQAKYVPEVYLGTTDNSAFALAGSKGLDGEVGRSETR